MHFEYHPKVPKPILDDPRGMLVEFRQRLHGKETPSDWQRSGELEEDFGRSPVEAQQEVVR